MCEYKGVWKDEAHHQAGRRVRQRLTPLILKRLFEVWRSLPVVRDAKMLWAATCLTFFGFLRVGEFTSRTVNSFDGNVHLSLADISVDCSLPPSMLIVRLKQSKTDQLSQGVTTVLGKSEKLPSLSRSKLPGRKGEFAWAPLHMDKWIVLWQQWERLWKQWAWTSMDIALGLGFCTGKLDPA